MTDNMKLSLFGIVRALNDCAPSIVLMLADRGAARRCAEVVLRDDSQAAGEFKSAEALAGYLHSLAKPQAARARQMLPAEQKALAEAERMGRATPPPPRRRAASPAAAPRSVALSSRSNGTGDIDALAEVLGCRVPLLRLASSRQVLAEHGIEPQRHDGRDAWPLSVPNASRVRGALMHAAASGGCWLGSESVRVGC